MTLSKLLAAKQFSLSQRSKETLLLPELVALTMHHATHCEPYARLVAATQPHGTIKAMAELPYVPASLFKTHFLSSVPDTKIVTTLRSSGTSGPHSRIAIDAETAGLQVKALWSVIGHVVESRRPPMIIVDTREVISDPAMLSARGAGVLGMMRFGRDHLFALDSNMRLDSEALVQFINQHRHGPILIFGFTFMVWKYLIHQMDTPLDLSRATLVHSGGWKKLLDQAVDNRTFRQVCAGRANLKRIYNFYGMVEQLGSVLLEGEDGLLYPPTFGDVIIRDPETWRETEHGRPGLIQVLSLIPKSYPGHSVLTEDIGVVCAVDSGIGGRLGKAIKVIGRAPRSELRGCSDVYAAT